MKTVKNIQSTIVIGIMFLNKIVMSNGLYKVIYNQGLITHMF